MQFIYPAFLLGFLTLAIPLLIHLFHFKKYKKVYFSNVQFLKNIQQQQASRTNLKNRLILLARLLVISFLVLAFARPLYIKTKRQAGNNNVVSIFLDNSYSMQAINRERSLLDEGKNAAKQIAAEYELNDRFQLVTQDFEGRYENLLSRDEFLDEVDKVKISSESRSLKQIINRQQGFLKNQYGVEKSLYVISDFQKNLGSPSDTINKDADNRVQLIKLTANPLPNVTVDSVWLLNAVHRPDENEKLVVRLHNYSDGRAEKIPLKLMINDRQKSLGSFTIESRSAQNDTLSFSGLQAGMQHAEIVLQDNPVVFDNQFYFAFTVQHKMPVLLINGGTTNQYLQAVFKTDEFFSVTSVAQGFVDYSALATYPVVALSDIKSISSGLAQQLKSYVQNGGVLLVFPGDMADVSSYRHLLEPLGAEYPDKLVTEQSKVVKIDNSNALFKTVFENMPQNPDLPSVSKYYQLTGNSRNSSVLMQLQNGKPFLSVYPSRKGKIYLYTVALDDAYSNLPHHALLVPLILRSALLSNNSQPLFYTIGDNEAIENVPFKSAADQPLRLEKGNETIIPDRREVDGSTLLYLSDQVKHPGIYELKKQDSTLESIAFNNSRSESDLTYLDDAVLKNMVKNSTVTPAANISVKLTVNTLNKGTELWKLCIILSLIFMAAEVLLVRFYKINNQQVAAPSSQ
jgi:hypothetical protein